jgi:hypothetical protein
MTSEGDIYIPADVVELPAGEVIIKSGEFEAIDIKSDDEELKGEIIEEVTIHRHGKSMHDCTKLTYLVVRMYRLH